MSGDSLDGDLRAISNLEEWWDERDAEEARRVRDSRQYNYRDLQLEAIRRLLQKIEGFEDIFYSATMRPKGLYFKKVMVPRYMFQSCRAASVLISSCWQI